MSDPEIALERLDDARVSADGRRVSFRVADGEGEGVRVDCDAADLGPMIAYLIGLGGNAAARREEVTPQTFGSTDRVVIEPIQTSDVGLMRDLYSSEVVLVARMHGFDLSFTITAPQLAALYKEIERAVPKAMLVQSDHHHDHDHDHGHHHHHHHDHE